MAGLNVVDSDELSGRINTIFIKLDKLFKETTPLIKEISNLREEAGLIFDELDRRGLITPDSKNVEKISK